VKLGLKWLFVHLSILLHPHHWVKALQLPIAINKTSHVALLHWNIQFKDKSMLHSPHYGIWRQKIWVVWPNWADPSNRSSGTPPAPSLGAVTALVFRRRVSWRRSRACWQVQWSVVGGRCLSCPVPPPPPPPRHPALTSCTRARSTARWPSRMERYALRDETLYSQSLYNCIT
jgi:hypothetical protein